MAAAGKIEYDQAQGTLLERLETLRRQCERFDGGGRGFRLFQRKLPPPKGLYVWGSVGRGKTMTMDLFFDSVAITAKRRCHFHVFMADAHRRIFDWRQLRKVGKTKGDDPITPVAEDLAREAKLLCFDEFAVRDIADAMILGRLFAALWAQGVTIVATSNVQPDDLYRDGLNRALFLPFIALIHQHMDIVSLDARTDYRLEKLAGHPVYYTPADEIADRALTDLFRSLTGLERGAPMVLTPEGLGREVHVPQASGRVARFTYADLCKKPLGAADFLEIAAYFHTIIMDDAPIIAANARNEAKRFIILIDALYDHHVKLAMSAAAPPHLLYPEGVGAEKFEFDRTVSRLIDMQSEDYLSAPHGHCGATAMNSTGLAET